jgi:hypothetical protein
MPPHPTPCSSILILSSHLIPKYQYKVEAWCEMFRNIVKILRWEVLSTSAISQAWRSPLVGCPRLLTQYIRTYPPYLEAVRPTETWGWASWGNRIPLITDSFRKQFIIVQGKNRNILISGAFIVCCDQGGNNLQWTSSHVTTYNGTLSPLPGDWGRPWITTVPRLESRDSQTRLNNVTAQLSSRYRFLSLGGGGFSLQFQNFFLPYLNFGTCQTMTTHSLHTA